MSTQPLVSVVTATYNMADFLEFAMKSVIGQTYKNWQHIIIDDGSTDGTKELVSRFNQDKRIEYHYQNNAGQTTAKNHGIRKANGHYICFLDADNTWEPDKLQKQIDLFSTIPSNFKIVYTEQRYIDGEGKRIFTPNIRRYAGNISAQLLFENFVTFNTAMIDRTCFEKLGMFDESLERSIDYELWLRFSTKFDFYYMPDVTTYYRLWEGQMSQDRERRYKVSAQIMEDFLGEHPGLIDKAVADKAWGYSFNSRARYYSSRRDYRNAYGYFLKALRHDPLSVNTWKSIFRTMLLWK